MGTFTPDPIPLDDDGYAVSFRAEEGAALRDFFKRYGVVIIRDVISEAQVSASAESIFNMAGLGPSPPTSKQELEKINWEDVYYSRYNMSKGFLGYEAPNCKEAWQNRLSPQLEQAFTTLFGRSDLLVKIDRFGMMRPTKFGDAEPIKAWQTTGEWIHWDQNPWLEPNFERIQAVLALSDHTSTSGGFHCIPGFCGQFHRWAKENAEFRMDSELVAVPTGDPIRRHIQRLPMRAGSACLWDSRTPHGNFPNASDKWRLCQYLGLHPAPHPSRQLGLVKTRADFMRLEDENGRLPACAKETQRERRLIGLESYDSAAEHTISSMTARQLGLWNDFPDLDPDPKDDPAFGYDLNEEDWAVLDDALRNPKSIWNQAHMPLFCVLSVAFAVCAAIWKVTEHP